MTTLQIPWDLYTSKHENENYTDRESLTCKGVRRSSFNESMSKASFFSAE